MRKLPHWAETLLPALSLTLGLQILRTIWPYLRNLLVDHLGWHPVLAALVPFLIFATAFLTGWLNRWLGLRRLLLLSTAGLGLARLAMQLWSGDPGVDMIPALLGAVCFSLFLPVYLATVRSQESNRSAALAGFAGAILLGLALDTALHGAFLTYDFIWQAGLTPVFLATALVAAQGIALGALLPIIPLTAHESPSRVTLPWLAFGPFLALQALIFQNPARLANLTGWSLPLAFGWVSISQGVSLWLATIWPWRRVESITLVGIVLVALLILTGSASPLIEALILLGGQVAAAVLFTTLVTALAGEASLEGLTRTGLVHGLGLMLMTAFIYLSYAAYLNLPLPFESGWPLSLAGLGVAIGAARAISLSTTSPPGARSWLAAKLALPLLFLPLLIFLTWRSPAPTATKPDSVRAMTYNVHNGFNTRGHLDLVALSQVIEAQQPDLLALQEVSRGSVVNGAADMLSWFSQRLGLPYVFTPAGEGLWGQATLSRYPILLAENYRLPPQAVRRSFAYLQLDRGQPQPLNVINTHYQPRYGINEVQLVHTETIFQFLAQHPSGPFIIMGDFNAEPDMPQMQPFFKHGFIDVIAGAGITPGYTARSDNPTSRIDYILISPDLTVMDVVIPASTASDHLSVAATIHWE